MPSNVAINIDLGMISVMKKKKKKKKKVTYNSKHPELLLHTAILTTEHGFKSTGQTLYIYKLAIKWTKTANVSYHVLFTRKWMNINYKFVYC